MESKKKCERIESDGIKKIDTFKEEFMKMVDNQLSIHEDNILSEIEKLFPPSRIGENIFQDQGSLDQLDKEGELRFKNKIGPGFCDLDGKKGQAFSFEGLTYQNKFGDLYIFKQIIEHAKLPSIANIVFISDDAKEDWVIQTSVQGKKYTFPRTELVCELKSESQIDNFMIIQSNKFVEHTSKNQSVHIDKSTVEIIKSVQSLYAKNKMKELDLKSLNMDRLNTYFYKDIIKKYLNDQEKHTSIGANINWVELKEQLYELEISIFTTDPSLRYSDGVNSVAYLISAINASVTNYEFYFKNNVRKNASFEKAGILELLDALFDQLFVSNILDAHQKSLDRIKNIISMISTSEI